MKIEVSIGEAIDKYTILKIKEEHIVDKIKLVNIKGELLLVENELIANGYLDIFFNEIHELRSINQQLWNIEDRIRIKESKSEFDNEFIEIARSVYVTNDMRFDIKNKINKLSNSKVKEEKSYA